jgi:hypothetical protein
VRRSHFVVADQSRGLPHKRQALRLSLQKSRPVRKRRFEALPRTKIKYLRADARLLEGECLVSAFARSV